MRSIIAQRYAKAIFALAKTGSTQEEWEGQLKQLAGLIETEDGLRKILLHPAVDVSKKQEVLNQLTGPLNVAETVKRLLNLLVQRHRLQGLPAVAVAFSELVDRAQGRQPVLVETAHPLSDHEEMKLRGRLEGIIEKRVELQREVNPDLMGGIVFQVGSLRYDGSIRGKLARLRAAVSEGV
jgi:F-type H+-transporting ATPase subunit delta